MLSRSSGWWLWKPPCHQVLVPQQEMQQEVQTKVQKMAIGDSADWRQTEAVWGVRQNLYQPGESLNPVKATRLPLRNNLFPILWLLFLLLHTVLNFYSFSFFLPFDGLLCVQAVGKFPVTVRSSTNESYPHPSCTHTHTLTRMHHHWNPPLPPHTHTYSHTLVPCLSPEGQAELEDTNTSPHLCPASRLLVLQGPGSWKSLIHSRYLMIWGQTSHQSIHKTPAGCIGGLTPNPHHLSYALQKILFIPCTNMEATFLEGWNSLCTSRFALILVVLLPTVN